MLQGKYAVTPYYIYNPWLKSTPLGYGLISRYVINQSSPTTPQQEALRVGNFVREEEEG